MMHMGLLGFGLGMSMPVMLVAVVFAIGAVIAGLSVVAAAFLKELPLRTSPAPAAAHE
jgi:hypothetical protein